MTDLTKVFLDLDNPNLNILSDDEAAKEFLSKFEPIIPSIGKRVKQVKRVGISYDVPSVAIFNQAKDLYYLGYFLSSIIVCRAAAEHLAYEMFFEEVEINGIPHLIESIADNLDFRKIVNEFLYNKKNGYRIIDSNTRKLFNKIYDLGNEWIHPHKLTGKVKIEDEAIKAIEITSSLMSSLRDVMEDFFISEGRLVKKETARKKIRPIILGKHVK